MIHQVKSRKYRPTSTSRAIWRNSKIKEEGKTTRLITTVVDEDGVRHTIVTIVKPETKLAKTKPTVTNIDDLAF